MCAIKFKLWDNYGMYRKKPKNFREVQAVQRNLGHIKFQIDRQKELFS